MLLGNYSALLKHPGRDIGGGAIGLGMERGAFNKSSMARGAFNLVTWEHKSGVPDGYRPPYCWVMPQADGALSARNNLAGSGDLVGAVAGGVNGSAVLAGTGTLTGDAALIVSLAAVLTGSGTISSAVTEAFLQLAATLSGSGSAVGVATALGNAAAALNGSGTIAGTTVATALGAMAADITVTGTGLTTANVGQAVWAALATAINNPGTAGGLLNGAGSAGDPWLTALPGAYAAGTAGYIIGNRLDVVVSTLAAPGDAMTLDVATCEQIADCLLIRSLAGGSNGGRTVQQTLRAGRNKVAIVGTTLTVYREDDVTPDWTAAVGTNPRDPLSSIDPS